MKRDGKPKGESRVRDGGTIPGAVPAQSAFSLHMANPAPIPVLLTVPHSGRRYPPPLLEMMRDPAAAVRLEDRFADLVAEAVARETGAGLLMAHAPRAMIDLNRAPDDVDWDMVADGACAQPARQAAGRRARSGLGLVPRRLPGLGEFWRRRMTGADLKQRIDEVHGPYHSMLSATLEALRDRWGAALLIDLHSMPPLQRGGPNGGDAMFVVGDRFGTSAGGGIGASALEHFAANGWKAAHNRPYAGGYALDRHGAPARGVHALQVEICRSAYLDHTLREPGPGLAAVVRVLTGLVRKMAVDLVNRRGFLQAAE